MSLRFHRSLSKPVGTLWFPRRITSHELKISSYFIRTVLSFSIRTRNHKIVNKKYFSNSIRNRFLRQSPEVVSGGSTMKIIYLRIKRDSRKSNSVLHQVEADQPIPNLIFYETLTHLKQTEERKMKTDSQKYNTECIQLLLFHAHKIDDNTLVGTYVNNCT